MGYVNDVRAVDAALRLLLDGVVAPERLGRGHAVAAVINGRRDGRRLEEVAVRTVGGRRERGSRHRRVGQFDVVR